MLSALTEITDPHTLGIHLGIEEYRLEIFENDHPNKVERQKSDVLNHWKRNCGECSWGVLATAVEKMKKHRNLAQKLREKHIQGEGERGVKVISKDYSIQGKDWTTSPFVHAVWLFVLPYYMCIFQ